MNDQVHVIWIKKRDASLMKKSPLIYLLLGSTLLLYIKCEIFSPNQTKALVYHDTSDPSSAVFLHQKESSSETSSKVTTSARNLTELRPFLESSLQIQKFIDPHSVNWKSWKGILYFFFSCSLVVLSGVASGLTLGLLSVDPVELKIAEASANLKNRKLIKEVIHIVSNRHLLLVTLLLTNSIALEALPIFLDRLFPSWIAVLISVIAVLIFGEILPQAFCTGRKQLMIAMRSVPLVRVLITLFFVVAWPIAKALDSILGVKPCESRVSRHTLVTLIQHNKAASAEEAAGNEDLLDPEEASILIGALILSQTQVKDVCISIGDDLLWKRNRCLDESTIRLILSRVRPPIPVYENHPSNIVGFVDSMKLPISVTRPGLPLNDYVTREKLVFVSPFDNLCDVLRRFRESNVSYALVSLDPQASQKALSSGTPLLGDIAATHYITLAHIFRKLFDLRINCEALDTTGLWSPYRITGSLTKPFQSLLGFPLNSLNELNSFNSISKQAEENKIPRNSCYTQSFIFSHMTKKAFATQFKYWKDKLQRLFSFESEYSSPTLQEPLIHPRNVCECPVHDTKTIAVESPTEPL